MVGKTAHTVIYEYLTRLDIGQLNAFCLRFVS